MLIFYININIRRKLIYILNIYPYAFWAYGDMAAQEVQTYTDKLSVWMHVGYICLRLFFRNIKMPYKTITKYFSLVR